MMKLFLTVALVFFAYTSYTDAACVGAKVVITVSKNIYTPPELVEAILTLEGSRTQEQKDLITAEKAFLVNQINALLAGTGFVVVDVQLVALSPFKRAVENTRQPNAAAVVTAEADSSSANQSAAILALESDGFSASS